MEPSIEATGRNWAADGVAAAYDHEISLLAAASYLALFAASGTVLVRLLTRKLSTPSGRWTKPEAVSYAVLLMLASCELPIFLSTPSEGLVDLIQGRDPLLNEILERVPAIKHGPAPPLLLRNRHIQFIPFLIQNEYHRLQGIPFQRVDVEVSDCFDKMAGCHTPDMNDTITLDVFPPFGSNSPYSKGFNRSSPIILFAPGLRSNSQDLPGNSIIRKAYERGFRSIAVNRRGHTPNRPLKSPRYNIFGDVDDLEQVYVFVKNELATKDTAFMLYGVSSGTAVTVSSLAKWDKRRRENPDRETPVFVASVDVSPGYDISKVLTRQRFLWPYNDLLMQGVKDHFVLQNEELLRSHDNDAVDQMLAATDMQQIVDSGVKFAGYENVTLYYEDTNPINEVRDIETPKLVLNAVDDPCCNIANLYEESPYSGHDGKTFAQMIRETERGLVAVTSSGSHCPFICNRNRWLPFVTDPLTGGWMLNSWADSVAIDYFAAALEVYGHRRSL